MGTHGPGSAYDHGTGLDEGTLVRDPDLRVVLDRVYVCRDVHFPLFFDPGNENRVGSECLPRRGSP
ncbi:hypothetical protein D3C81_1251560 [compost metagenome]